MKKILYNIVVLLAVACAVVLCGDDDGVASNGTPGKDAAGTYSGTWSVLDEETGETTTFSGDISLSEDESKPYNVSLNITCSGTTPEEQELADVINGKSSVTNITYAGEGFLLTNAAAAANASKAGDLEAICHGRINGGNITVKFVSSIFDPLTYVTVVKYFSFVGQKEVTE